MCTTLDITPTENNTCLILVTPVVVAEFPWSVIQIVFHKAEVSISLGNVSHEKEKRGPEWKKPSVTDESLKV